MAAEFGTKEFCFGFGMMVLALVTVLVFIFSLLDRHDNESFGRSFYLGLGFIGVFVLTTIIYMFWKLVLQEEECSCCKKSKVDFWKLTKATTTFKFTENDVVSKRLVVVDLPHVYVPPHVKSKRVIPITHLLKKLLKNKGGHKLPTETVV